jgi:hypothetical protein
MRYLYAAIVLFVAAHSHAQTPFNDRDSLNVNNLNVRMMVHGDMWFDPATYQPHCKFPANDQRSLHIASALWMSAMDPGGNLHVSSQTYRQFGSDYWPGPLDGSGGLDYATSAKWAKLWKVTRDEIGYHKTNATRTVSSTPTSILSWPAKGNVYAAGKAGTPLTVDREMAPFVDLDGDGVYEPLNGEYPDFRGDAALWWVFSDYGPTHTETNGVPLQVEVHAMAYAYKRSTPIDNVVYYDYTIENRSSVDYSQFRMAVWDDVDLGYYLDDYICFDSARRMGIVYNATNDDGASAGYPDGSYGANPPASGITMIRVPGDAGTSFVPMGSFTNYNNDASPQGNPVLPAEYDNYMRARMKSGTHFQENGVDIDYVYAGVPSVAGDSSECEKANIPGDRRVVMATRSFPLPAGQKEHLVYALVASAAAGGCPSVNLSGLNTVADTAWNVYHNPPPELGVNDRTAGLRTINMYPNPAHDVLFIEGAHQGAIVVVSNLLGAVVASATHTGTGTFKVPLNEMPVGVYVVRYVDAAGTVANTIMKR